MRRPVARQRALLCCLALLVMTHAAQARAAASSATTTVVVARPDSPYRSLARDIAIAESVPLVNSMADALAMRPEFVLWVVSPRELSDQAVASVSLALDRTLPRPSAGLITGSTVVHARGLYDRASRVRGDRTAAVLGEDTFTAAHLVEGVGEELRTWTPSGPADVLGLLKRADYLHYAGHGSSSYWRPLPDARIAADDIPELGRPVVVSTMSCQTARIWEQGSIALRMVDAGAAAYSGFYYSPMSGYQIGEEDGPFRRTWSGVPIGHVVAAMNEGARKGYASFPFHLLVGDPRIALQTHPPCQLEDHGETGGVRTLSCPDAPSGLIPLRIPQGARYAAVEIAGWTAAWDREPFYNRRLQMATIGDDRILLVDHGGGDLVIRARVRPTLMWLASDPVADALDTMLVSMADRRHGGDVIALVLGAAAMLLAFRPPRRRLVGRAHLVPAAAVGAMAAILHASYGFARQQVLVVVDKPIVFSPLGAVGTGVLVGCGAVIFFAARSWRGRLWGTVIATSVGWTGGLIALGVTTATSVAIAARTGIGTWIYRPRFYPFVVSAVGCAALAVVYRAAGSIGGRTTDQRQSR